MRLSKKQIHEFIMTLLAVYRESPDIRKVAYQLTIDKALQYEHDHFKKVMKPKTKTRRPRKCPMCMVNKRLPIHGCPYKEEVYGDMATMCACCVSCQNTCSRDI